MKKLFFLFAMLFSINMSAQFTSVSNSVKVRTTKNVVIDTDYIMIGHKKFRRKLLCERKFVHQSDTYIVSNTSQGFKLYSKKAKKTFSVVGTHFPEKRIKRGKFVKKAGIVFLTLLGISAVFNN